MLLRALPQPRSPRTREETGEETSSARKYMRQVGDPIPSPNRPLLSMYYVPGSMLDV